MKASKGKQRQEALLTTAEVRPPVREPTLCPGCPHRGSGYAIKRATRKKNVIIGGDIGCHGLLGRPPYQLTKWPSFCMGAGLGITQGASHKVKDTQMIALIGDSTFFHAGLPLLLNAAQQNANLLLVIMDNKWTGMTGHQPTASTTLTISGESLEAVDIPELLKAMGVNWVRRADPFHPSAMTKIIREGLAQLGLKAIVAEGECILQTRRRDRRLRGIPTVVYEIDMEKCRQCDLCVKEFACPSILKELKDGAPIYFIDPGTCTGCGACADICPPSAIIRKAQA